MADRLRQAAGDPDRMPSTADSTVDTPTSAIVGPALLAISDITGWLSV